MSTTGWFLVVVFVLAVAYGMLCLAVRRRLPVEVTATQKAELRVCMLEGSIGGECGGNHGRCPCPAYENEYERTCRFESWLLALTLQKDTASACIGCRYESEHVCGQCTNKGVHQRLVLEMEALGEVAA